MNKITCTILGCAHGSYGQLKLQGGDLLIITGDCTARDTIPEFEEFVRWLNKQNYKKKIVIGGNHDGCLENDGHQLLKWAKDCEYLCNDGTTYEGLKIWGSPNSLLFPRVNPACKAFMKTERELGEIYTKIPDDTDILITHTPPYGILDKNKDGIMCGSTYLRLQVEGINPRYHFFSHIHENQGYCMLKSEGYGEENNTHCYNVSIMDGDYRPVNLPVTIEI